jgi:hypothetical protein
MVYAWFTHGLRMVYAWFTHGLRMVYAWFVHGLRKVYAWFTHGLRKVCAGCANFCIWAYFNPGFMQVWFMQYYVRKVRKEAAIRVFSKAAPIRLVQMPVLPAGTLSGALLPRDLRAATRFLA